jgi:hypothetical protein
LTPGTDDRAMQTFLPYADFQASSAVLDDRRLGKQRVETFQILRALTWPDYAWKNHPAVRMWRGFVPALVRYGVTTCEEWTRRGHADTVRASLLAFTGGAPAPSYVDLHETGQLPPWLGLDALHLSHQSALVRKDPAWYRPLSPDAPDDLPYWWPPEVFPRWPVRAGTDAVDLDLALALLGYAARRPGQAEPAAAVVRRQDCIGVFRPGFGGSGAALLAGLVTPGRTLWVFPDDGARGRYRSATRLPPPAPRRTAARPWSSQGPVARSPGAADAAAMAAEDLPSEWAFRAVTDLTDGVDRLAADRLGLLVVDRAGALTPAQRRRVGQLRARLPEVPLLAVIDRADADARRQLTEQLALNAPAHVGGGWDVPAYLDACLAGSAGGRRAAVVEAVRRSRPALVVASTRAHGDRVVPHLVRSGLRARVLTPRVRDARRAEVAAAWRSRRLDAVVVTAEMELSVLGRTRPAIVVAVDAPSTVDDWRDVIARSQALSAVVVAGPRAPAWATAWACAATCLRELLLQPFGEPIATPCGRCARDHAG